MSYIKFHILYIILAIALGACVPNSSKLNNKKSTVLPIKNGHSIIFYHLDNYALIYKNDKLIVDTRSINTSTKTDVDLLVDLSSFIKNETRDQIKIEGYNSECDYCRENRWKFVYEIYKDGESLDYITKETSQHDGAGLKFTETFTFGELNN